MVNVFDQFDVGQIAPGGVPQQTQNVFEQFQAGAPAAPEPMQQEAEDVLGIPVATEADPIVERTRGALLPIARTETGRGVAAVPGFLEPARRAVVDLLSGQRQASEITGEEAAALGGVFNLPNIARRAGATPVLQQGVAAAETGAQRGAEAARQAIRAQFPDLPETQTLRQISQNAFARAESAGIALNPRAFSNLSNRIVREVQDAGFDPRIQTRSAVVLQRIGESVGSGRLASLQELTVLRRLAQGVTGGADPDDARVAQIIVRQIDEALDRVRPGDLVGDAARSRQGIEDLRQARLFWKRFRRAETVDGLVERARNRAGQFTGSGFENALRTEFRTLANNRRRFRVFSPSEQRAIRRVVRGGAIENAFRAIGRFAPTGVVSTGLGGGAGFAIGGPVGAAAVLGAGAASRAIATGLTGRNIRRVQETVRGVR